MHHLLSSEGNDESVNMRILAFVFVVCKYKVWVLMKIRINDLAPSDINLAAPCCLVLSVCVVWVCECFYFDTDMF